MRTHMHICSLQYLCTYHSNIIIIAAANVQEKILYIFEYLEVWILFKMATNQEQHLIERIRDILSYMYDNDIGLKTLSETWFTY